MPIVPIRNYGQLGVIQDTPSESLPINAWSDALNVRFTGGQIEKVLESAPVVDDPEGSPDISYAGTDCQFILSWTDAFSSYVMAIFRDGAGRDMPYRWDQRTGAPDVNSKAAWDYIGPLGDGGEFLGYDPGVWQGFEWGATFIVNNGTTAPQIWDDSLQRLIDLPNWGIISDANDIASGASPSVNTQAKCRVIIPLKNYLVALNVTESGLFQPNKVWWSDPAAAASVAFTPSWDYESPSTLSGQSEVGIGSGNIVTALALNDNLIIYTDSDASAMSVVGGAFVMGFRRLFNKGAAGMHTVCEFNNRHFVVARDQIYIHDGSKPELIAQDRVEREFFKRIGKKDGIQVY